VNADDFGMASDVNRGVIRAHQAGLVTSASLMVRRSAAREAAAMARDHPRLAVGLHLDLGEWVYAGDTWKPRYEVVPCDDAAAVSAEAAAQIECFSDLLGKRPTHLDSHQHVHRTEPARQVVGELGRTMNLPVRDVVGGIAYEGGFYGQTAEGSPHPEGITLKALLRIVDALGAGLTEISCHPAAGTAFQSTYLEERQVELAVLCNPMLRLAVDTRGIELVSYQDVAWSNDKVVRLKSDKEVLPVE
jgi:predicted glycoside hydrolase/deacetylase ChbG (UPF0249 family)